MPLGPIELGGRRAFVLGFDPEAAGLPSLVSGSVVIVTPDGTVSRDLRDRLEQQAPGVTFSEARLGPDGVAVVHTLWTARVLPLLAAIRAGVRTFHLVDAPGSSFRSNARGTLAWALKRAFARLLQGLPLIGRWVECLVGHRLDVPWPSATATLRTLDSSPRGASTPALAAATPSRAVHWLPELGPRADEAVALLEHLVPRTRALGVAVEILIPGSRDAYDVRARRLERLGATCRFLPRRPWRLWADRPRLPGFAPGLVHDLERHVHADVLLPLLEDLLERTPRARVVHGWLEPTLSSASVVGLAGALAGARVILHIAGALPARGPEELTALCLRRLAESDPDVAILTTDPRVARDLVAWAGLPPGRISETPHVVVPEVPLPETERGAQRRLLGVAEGTFLLVALGNLGGEAASLLLGVVRRLLDEGVDVRVFHAGPSGTEARLRVRDAGFGPRLRLLGCAPDEHEYVRLADAVLGVGDPFARSRACGTPVVVPAGDEGFQSFQGFSYPRGDTAAAADHLLRLAREPDLRRSLLERSRALASDGRAPERFVEAVLERYSTR